MDAFTRQLKGVAEWTLEQVAALKSLFCDNGQQACDQRVEKRLEEFATTFNNLGISLKEVRDALRFAESTSPAFKGFEPEEKAELIAEFLVKRETDAFQGMRARLGKRYDETKEANRRLLDQYRLYKRTVPEFSRKNANFRLGGTTGNNNQMRNNTARARTNLNQRIAGITSLANNAKQQLLNSAEKVGLNARNFPARDLKSLTNDVFRQQLGQLVGTRRGKGLGENPEFLAKLYGITPAHILAFAHQHGLRGNPANVSYAIRRLANRAIANAGQSAQQVNMNARTVANLTPANRFWTTTKYVSNTKAAQKYLKNEALNLGLVNNPDVARALQEAANQLRAGNEHPNGNGNNPNGNNNNNWANLAGAAEAPGLQRAQAGGGNFPNEAPLSANNNRLANNGRKANNGTLGANRNTLGANRNTLGANKGTRANNTEQWRVPSKGGSKASARNLGANGTTGSVGGNANANANNNDGIPTLNNVPSANGGYGGGFKVLPRIAQPEISTGRLTAEQKRDLWGHLRAGADAFSKGSRNVGFTFRDEAGVRHTRMHLFLGIQRVLFGKERAADKMCDPNVTSENSVFKMLARMGRITGKERRGSLDLQLEAKDGAPSKSTGTMSLVPCPGDQNARLAIWYARPGGASQELAVPMTVRFLYTSSESAARAAYILSRQAVCNRFPHFPLVYGVGVAQRSSGGKAIMVMQEAPHGTLLDWVQGGRRGHEAACALVQVLLALAVVHGRGMQHGGLKMTSVLFMRSRRPGGGQRWSQYRIGNRDVFVSRLGDLFMLDTLAPSIRRRTGPNARHCEVAQAIRLFKSQLVGGGQRDDYKQLMSLVRRFRSDAVMFLHNPQVLTILQRMTAGLVQVRGAAGSKAISPARGYTFDVVPSGYKPYVGARGVVCPEASLFNKLGAALSQL